MNRIQNRMNKIFIKASLILLFCFPSLELGAQPFGAPDYAENAMVVSAHQDASLAGQEILKMGGNAVDAAVSTGFALAVVFPVAGNIGGGGFMVIRFPDGNSTSFDYRETAPASAFRDMFLDENGDYLPKVARLGHLASGTPGSVAGMLAAHSKYGKLDIATVLAPAIRLAEEGFELTRRQARRFNNMQNRFAPFEGTMKYFSKEGLEYQNGELFVQKDLAEVLKKIAVHGRDGFYKGDTADLIVREMENGRGMISHKDLEDYRAIERETVVSSYREHRIITMSPPSSGGIALAQLLNSVESYDLSLMGYGSSASSHLMGEAMRRVYADRAEWLGDPDFYAVPQEELIAKNYSSHRMGGFHPSKAALSSEISHGQPAPKESIETTHYSVVDSDGTGVSVTTTINGGFGSMVVVDGAGFFLNNEMDDFSSKPGVPNMFGLVGSEANAIEPRKRMLSSMTPSIVEDREGRLLMVLGTPGGGTIITQVFQTIVNVIDHGMTIQAAVSAPRIHHQWLPDVLFHEPFAFSKDVQLNLESRGWELRARTGYVGSVDAILVKYDENGNSRLEGGADPRGDNTAKGF